jgi:hypothetical protein
VGYGWPIPLSRNESSKVASAKEVHVVEALKMKGTKDLGDAELM